MNHIPALDAHKPHTIGDKTPEGLTYIGRLQANGGQHCFAMIVENAIPTKEYVQAAAITDDLLQHYAHILDLTIMRTPFGERLTSYDYFNQKTDNGVLRLATGEELLEIFAQTNNEVTQSAQCLNYTGEPLFMGMPGHGNIKYMMDADQGSIVLNKRAKEKYPDYDQRTLSVMLMTTQKTLNPR